MKATTNYFVIVIPSHITYLVYIYHVGTYSKMALPTFIESRYPAFSGEMPLINLKNPYYFLS